MKNRILLYNPDWMAGQYAGGMVWTKGHARYRDRCYADAEFCGLVGRIAGSGEPFENFVSELNGNFVLALERDGGLTVASDRLRSWPLCWTEGADGWIVTDDILRLSADIGIAPEIGLDAMEQFLLSGFVIGGRTVFRDVAALQAAEVVELNDCEVLRKRYFLYDPQMNTVPDPAVAVREADALFEQAVRRMADSAPDVRNWIVPLSGGHDSRLVVNYLYRAGIRNVVCYSYGIPENPQSRLSREVAAALGYEWHFVEYTRDLFEEIHRAGVLDRYFRFATSSACCMPHTQDFPAVYALVQRGIAGAGDIFVPGHTFDFLAGSHLTPQIGAIRTAAEAVDAVQRHFSNWGNRELKGPLRSETERILRDTGVSLRGFPECFDWQERQAKFIMHSLRVYDFFGFGWRTPWWDNDLTAYWKDLDIVSRQGRNFFFRIEKQGILDPKLAGIPFENELCPPRVSKPLSRRVVEAMPPALLSRMLRMAGVRQKFRINEGLHDLYGDTPIDELLAPFSALPKPLRRRIAPFRKRMASQYDYHQVTLALAIRRLFYNGGK